MSKSKTNKKCDENEEYRIVNDEAPVSSINLLQMHKIATQNPEALIQALGIREGNYDLSRINREGGLLLHSAIMRYEGDSPTRSELRIVESRAAANNGRSILTPEDIRRTFDKRPDIGVIRMANGILQIFGSIRQNSDIPLIEHGEGRSLISDRERDVMRNMMAYRNKVFTTINVERPSDEEIDSWIHLFMDLLIKMYQTANASYTGDE